MMRFCPQINYAIHFIKSKEKINKEGKLMKHTFELKKVCPKSLSFDLEDGQIKNIYFDGGCPGNLLGISRLAEGQDAKKIAALFKSIPCGSKKNSCPGELSKSIIKALSQKNTKTKAKGKVEKIVKEKIEEKTEEKPLVVEAKAKALLKPKSKLQKPNKTATIDSDSTPKK
jgi:uncharacterized protein (TIGR03905 family)